MRQQTQIYANVKREETGFQIPMTTMNRTHKSSMCMECSGFLHCDGCKNRFTWYGNFKNTSDEAIQVKKLYSSASIFGHQFFHPLIFEHMHTMLHNYNHALTVMVYVN